VGRVVSLAFRGEACDVVIAAPPALAPYLVSKGSVAVDGVSLTVNAVEAERFGVTLIPHTVAATHLARRRAGDAVNLEVDPIAKHVERWVRLLVGPRPGPAS
jgi:riboflavin synthase alpha subunit